MTELFYHPNDKVYPYRAVDDFCEEVRREVGMAYAVAVNSGTSALHLALLSAGIGVGDRVLCPSLAFVALVNAVKYCGAEPVFYDMEDSTRINLYGQSLKGVRAMIVMDLLGHLVNPYLYKPFKKRGIVIIEDACQALGSVYLPGFERTADYVALSFNWNKIITTGSGGMVLTNKTAEHDYMKYLAGQAKDDSVFYNHHEVGYNYKMNSVQAEMGLREMKELQVRIGIKRNIAARYHEAFDWRLWRDAEWEISNYWLNAITVPNRNIMIRHLSGKGIGCRPLWAIHAPYPVADEYVKTTVCLPSHPWLLPQDQDKVIKAVKEVL